MPLTNLTKPAVQKNYISYGDFEIGSLSGWTVGLTGALTNGIPTATPTFSTATAGTPAASTFGLSVINVAPLAGNFSLGVSDSATSTVGNCVVSDVIPLTQIDQAKVLSLKFSYKLISGAANFSGTNANSFGIAVYDVTGGAWLGVAGNFSMIQSTGVGTASATFQTNATTDSIRVVIYNATAVTGGFSLYLDDFFLGQQTLTAGFSGPVGQIITTGSLTPPAGFLYCNGASVSVSQYQDLFNVIGYNYGGAGASFTLPNFQGVFPRGAGSQTIGGKAYSGTLGTSQGDQFQGHKHSKGETAHVHDTTFSKYSPTLTAGGTVVNFLDAPGGTVYSRTGGASGANSNVTIEGVTNDATYGNALFGGETRPANVTVAFHIRYLASYQLSSDTDTRVVAMTAFKSTTQSLANTTQVVITGYDVPEIDTHGSFNRTTGFYSASVAGIYNVTATVDFDVNATGYRFIIIHKNGLVYQYGTQAAALAGDSTRISVSTLVPCAAGDTMSMAAWHNGGTVNIRAAASMTKLSIHRLSGPAVVQSSETVAASRQHSTGQSIPNNSAAYVDFNVSNCDSHGIYTPGTGYNSGTGGWTTAPIFRVPVAGYYEISASLFYAGAPVLGAQYDCDIYVNNVIANGAVIFAPGTGGIFVSTGTAIVTRRLNAGDLIGIVAFQNSGAAKSLHTNTVFTWVNLKKLGN